MGVGEIWIEFEGPLEFGFGGGEIKQAPERATQGGMGFGRRRINGQSFLGRRFRFGSGYVFGDRTVVRRGDVIVGQPDIGEGVAGVLLNGLVEVVFGFSRVSGVRFSQ